MFTPGFKFFAGAAVIGLIGAFVYGLSSGDPSGPDYFGFVDRQSVIGLISLGWKGNIGSSLGTIILLFFAGSAAFVGGTAVAFRDADVEAVAQLDGRSSMPSAQRPTTPSYWPFASALGVGVLLMGLVLDTKVFWILGLAILAIVAVEWSLTGWADRSTGDADTNEAIRSRVMAPFEIPLLATLSVGVIALAFSRVFLTVSKLGAVGVAGVAALIVFLVALLAVLKPNLSRRTMGALIGGLAVTVIALGVISAAVGPREIEHPGEHSEDHSEETTVSDE